MKRINYFKILFAFAFTMVTLFVRSQDTLEMQRNENGKIHFARFKATETRKLKDGSNFLKTILQTKPDDAFRLFKETSDSFGVAHQRYQQYYKGIKVEGAEYLLHGKVGL